MVILIYSLLAAQSQPRPCGCLTITYIHFNCVTEQWFQTCGTRGAVGTQSPLWWHMSQVAPAKV